MNEENAYNLIDEPWIPVLMQNGTNRRVSLGEVFADADGQIADLALNPYERVAVFRLLLCIAQAALGPERLKDERAWRAAKDAVGTVSSEYLKKWHHRFFLYGPHAFLQPDDVVAVNETSYKPHSTLVFELASGNNSTLFDHAATDPSRLISQSTLTIGFLVYQNFSANGLSGKCIWSGMETEKSVKGAPCREQSMLFALLRGNSIIESVWLNLMTCEQVENDLKAEWGCPAWELTSLSRSDSDKLPGTFLGHLAPLSRSIKFEKGSTKCILGGGLVYPPLPYWREPTASVTMKDDGSLTYISANPSRMPWRDLTSILSVHSTSSCKGALALRHIESLQEEDNFSIWTGGIKWEPGQAKLIDTVEWFATLSVSMIDDFPLQRYESAIKRAESQKSDLRHAAKVYAGVLKVDDASRYYQPAEKVYWGILAQPDNQRIVLGVESPTYKDDWKKATLKAAEEAYRRACPAVTARQMEAYAQGFAKLWVPDGKKDKVVEGIDSKQDEGGDYV